MKTENLKQLENLKPDIRYLNDMQEVIYDKEWLKTARDRALYYMYRGLKKEKGLRYDITFIPGQMLGQEFVKTKGHYHKGKYGELYAVLKGEAIYLLQKETKGKIEDVFYVRAKKGNYIIIPPFYGHVTINPSAKKDLYMANWISVKCRSDYGLIEKKQGAVYFYTKSGWVKNKNYKTVPRLKSKKPLKNLPKDLNFLKSQ